DRDFGTTTVPPSAASRPARMRSSVVLPVPDGPSRATKSPCRSCRSTPSSTARSPNTRRTPRASTANGPVSLPDSLGREFSDGDTGPPGERETFDDPHHHVDDDAERGVDENPGDDDVLPLVLVRVVEQIA